MNFYINVFLQDKVLTLKEGVANIESITVDYDKKMFTVKAGDQLSEYVNIPFVVVTILDKPLIVNPNY